jgi:hypothetical protein
MNPSSPPRQHPRTARPFSPGLALAGAAVVAVPAISDGAAGIVARHWVGLAVWSLLALGLLLDLLPRAVPPRQARLLIGGLIMLAALSALALAWTSSAEQTVEEVARVTGYGGLVALGMLAIDAGHWRSMAAGISLAAAGVCALAVVARLFPAEFPSELVSIAGGRLAYPLGYWNALAAWSAMTVAMGLAWSADGHRTAVRTIALATVPIAGTALYLTYSRGGIVATALGVGLVTMLAKHRTRAVRHALIGLVLTAAVVAVMRTQQQIADGTGGDGGVIVLVAILVACAAAALAARADRRRTDRTRVVRPPMGRRPARSLLLGICACAVVLPLIYVAIGSTEPVAANGKRDPSARLLSLDGSRPLYWESAFDAFESAPLWGIGPGTFEFWWSRTAVEPDQVRDAHALYLEQAAELGLPGLLAVAALCGGALGLALLPLQRGEGGGAPVAMAATVAIYLGYAAIDWLWESTAVTLLALTAAVTAGASASSHWPGYRRPSNSPAKAGSTSGERPRWARVSALALVAGVAAGIAIQVPGLVATSRVEGSAAALRSGSDAEAAHLASDAIEAAPWAASGYAQRAVVESARGQDRAAALDALRAARREPLNFRRWLAVAELEANAGDRGNALTAYARARSLSSGLPSLSEYRRNLPRRIQGANGSG